VVKAFQPNAFQWNGFQTGSMNVYPDGLYATGFVGVVTTQFDSTFSVTGVVGTGEVGIALATGDANIDLTGLSATGYVGDVSLIYDANVYPTGLVGTGFTNSVTVTLDANVFPNGLSANALVGLSLGSDHSRPRIKLERYYACSRVDLDTGCSGRGWNMGPDESVTGFDLDRN